MLHRRRVERVADCGEERVARVPVVAEHANLDQLVREEIDVDFVQHRRGESVVADGDHGMQRMRARAMSATLGRC